MEVHIPISVGELFDRITILRIKGAQIEGATKRTHVLAELSMLETILEAKVAPDKKAMECMAELFRINSDLWEVEDRLRLFEAESRFENNFVEAARSVYRLNDARHRMKQQLSLQYDSAVVEEKSYA